MVWSFLKVHQQEMVYIFDTKVLNLYWLVMFNYRSENFSQLPVIIKEGTIISR